MLNFILAFMFPFGQVGPIFPGPGGVNAGTTPVSYTFNSAAQGGPMSSDPTTGVATAVTGGLLVAYCQGASSSGATWSVTSSPSNTWVSLTAVFASGTGGGSKGQFFYALSPTSGSTTATCSLASGPFGTEIAFLLSYSRAGAGSATFDVSAPGSTGTNAPSVTTSSFSTTAAGIVVSCGGVPDNISGQSLTTGGSSGTVHANGGTAYSVFCGDVSFASAHPTITSTLSYGGSFSPWNATAAAFK